MKNTAAVDGARVPIKMEQEPGSAGVNTIDTYGREVVKGFDFLGERSSGSKPERAGPWSAAAERGHFKVLRARWNDEWFNEVEAFPYGTHDDQVDAVSGAFKMLQEPQLAFE